MWEFDSLPVCDFACIGICLNHVQLLYLMCSNVKAMTAYRTEIFSRYTEPSRNSTLRIEDSFNRHLSRFMRKPTFCICENKDADQLRGNLEADQRLFFSLHR